MSLLPDAVRVRLHPPVELPRLDELAAAHGIVLPADHRATLLQGNGAEVYGGYARLFGIGAGSGIDAVQWNDPDHWKFAWQGRCAGYWCFAETAWGDQYAYDMERLRDGDERVHFLDCLSMTPTEVASSFADFMKGEFARIAREPYDSMTVAARETFGELDAQTHLVYVPSPLLGGAEDVKNVQTMPARSAMIINGDIAVQLDAGPPTGTVREVRPYKDAAGRSRLQLDWS